MRRMEEGTERASFTNEVSEALPVNSGLSFRRAFSIVPASTRRLACARKYHDWWARNSSRISSILTLLSISPPLSPSVCVASLHSLRTSTYSVWRAKFTRNTQWNLILRAHTFVFGHLTHHLPRLLFDRSTPSYGCLSRRVSFLLRCWMRVARNLEKSIKRDYIGWRTCSLSRDSSLNSRDSFIPFGIILLEIHDRRRITSRCWRIGRLNIDQLKEYLFPIGVKYGKNICLSDGYAYAGA